MYIFIFLHCSHGLFLGLYSQYNNKNVCSSKNYLSTYLFDLLYHINLTLVILDLFWQENNFSLGVFGMKFRLWFTSVHYFSKITPWTPFWDIILDLFLFARIFVYYSVIFKWADTNVTCIHIFVRLSKTTVGTVTDMPNTYTVEVFEFKRGIVKQLALQFCVSLCGNTKVPVTTFVPCVTYNCG